MFCGFPSHWATILSWIALWTYQYLLFAAPINMGLNFTESKDSTEVVAFVSPNKARFFTLPAELFFGVEEIFIDVSMFLIFRFLTIRRWVIIIHFFKPEFFLLEEMSSVCVDHFEASTSPLPLFPGQLSMDVNFWRLVRSIPHPLPWG